VFLVIFKQPGANVIETVARPMSRTRSGAPLR
jgi:hypothetical protein